MHVHITNHSLYCWFAVLHVEMTNRLNKKHLKNVGHIRHSEPFYIAIHQVSLLSHAINATLNSVDRQCPAVVRHALSVRSKGQGDRQRELLR